MTAFLCILDRSGATLDPREVRRLAEPLAAYGADLSTACDGPLGVAVRHPRVPQADRRYGPLTDPGGGVIAAVAGRFRALDRETPGGAGEGRSTAPACASQALDAYLRDGLAFLAGTSGSFVVVVADPRRGLLTVVRDHLGDRKAYYALDRRWLIAASEPAAILAHGAVSDELDERSAARFLGFDFCHSERTFFRRIQELPPGHRLWVTASDSRSERYWRFRTHPRDRWRSAEDVRAAFRGHLRRSIAAQLEGLEPEGVGLSLSGGLDSTTVAALAPRATPAFSWRFEDAADCDERRGVEAVAAHLEKRVRWVDGDGCFPLAGDYVERFVHPNSPYVNAFAALKCRLYRAARAEGCRRILVGDGGDALYSAERYWLRDLLGSGDPGALASLLGTVRRAWRGDRLARLALRCLPPLSALPRPPARRPRPWLTALGRSRLPRGGLSPILPQDRRRRRHELIVGAKHSELESEEARLFARCGIGRGNPFWSWPLLEMVINLPAWWYRRDGRSKVLTREAMRGLLPETVLEAGRAGLLGSFYLRGIEIRRDQIRQQVFRRPRSDWQRYVDRSWLEEYLDATGAIRFGHTILWRVVSYELWQRRLIGRRTARRR